MKLFKCSISVLAIAAMSFAATQATFYASPTGSGTTCSEAQPGSLTSVRDKIRTVNSGMSGDIVVMLRGGTYTLSSTFTLGAQDGGANGNNVIYQAYPGETPVISGGQRITGWTLSDAGKNIYSANVGTSVDTRQLYVNGIRATRARSVDASGWSENVSGSGSFNCPSAVSSWANVNCVEVVLSFDWKFQRSKLSSVSGTTAQGTSYGVWSGGAMLWIENAYELLDAPGEWYLNRTSGVLYYKPRAAENMSSAEVLLPKLETLIEGQNVNHLQFKGISFSYATWLSPNSNGLNMLQADNCNGGWLPGNITFTGSSNLRFEGNTFTRLGSTALRIPSGNHIVIYNNTFQDISGSGMSIGNTSSGTQTTYVTVDNNLVRDCAAEYMGCVGIFVLYSENTVLTHNEIRHLPYTGISVGWGWNSTILASRNGEISYNRIDSVMGMLHDGGAIYTLSNQPGTHVFGNYISNQFSYNQHGLYPDEASCHMRWYNNVLSRVPRWLHMWTGSIQYDTVENNWYDGGDPNLGGTNCIIRNNTLVSSGNWPAEAQAIINNAGRLNPNAVAIPTITPGSGTFMDSVMVAIACATPGAQIRYTTNGNEPTASSTLYAAPFWIRTTTIVKAIGTKVDINNSPILSATYTKSTLRDPDNVTNATAGLSYSYYEGAWSALPDFGALTPVKSGTCANFDLLPVPVGRNESFGLRFTGFIDVPADGIYNFIVTSDDAATFFVGGQEVVTSHWTAPRSALIGLKAGKHAVRLDFYQGNGGRALLVNWACEQAGITSQTIPSSRLFQSDVASVVQSPRTASPATVARGNHSVRVYDAKGNLRTTESLGVTRGRLPAGIYIVGIGNSRRVMYLSPRTTLRGNDVP